MESEKCGMPSSEVPARVGKPRGPAWYRQARLFLWTKIHLADTDKSVSGELGRENEKLKMEDGK